MQFYVQHLIEVILFGFVCKVINILKNSFLVFIWYSKVTKPSSEKNETFFTSCLLIISSSDAVFITGKGKIFISFFLEDIFYLHDSVIVFSWFLKKYQF